MKNRITEILDKFNKTYTIDEDGYIVLNLIYHKEDNILGLCVYRQLCKVKVIDKKLGIVHVVDRIIEPLNNKCLRVTEHTISIELFVEYLFDQVINRDRIID